MNANNELITKPTNLPVPDIIQLFIGLCDPEMADTFESDLEKFIDDLYCVEKVFII